MPNIFGEFEPLPCEIGLACRPLGRSQIPSKPGHSRGTKGRLGYKRYVYIYIYVYNIRLYISLIIVCMYHMYYEKNNKNGTSACAPK